MVGEGHCIKEGRKPVTMVQACCGSEVLQSPCAGSSPPRGTNDTFAADHLPHSTPFKSHGHNESNLGAQQQSVNIS